MIRLTDVGFAYGQKETLKHLSLEVKKGAMCAVMGPNGCGKSTLLRCVAGLNVPQSGELRLGGRRLEDYTARGLAQMLALVQQQANSELEFEAWEVVMMGRNPYQKRLQNESEEDRRIVEESMRQTHCWHLKERRPCEMSGGELQRVMIARALAQQTPVMLLDEPTSNLDIAHQMEIMQLLSDINEREGKTVLIVVHDLNLAYRYCKDLLLMKEGEKVYHGDMKEGLTPERIEEVFDVRAGIYENNIFFKK